MPGDCLTGWNLTFGNFRGGKRLEVVVSRGLRVFPILLFTLLCALAIAQQDVAPQASLTIPSAKSQPGSKVNAVLTLTFGDGLHAYQNPPSEDYMIPVTVKSTSTDVKLVKVAYPVGKDEIVGGETKPVKVYEGTIKIPITLQAPGKAGSYDISLSIQYQQCTNNNCFPPKSVTATSKLIVASAFVAPPEAIPPSKKPEQATSDTQKGEAPVQYGTVPPEKTADTQKPPKKTPPPITERAVQGSGPDKAAPVDSVPSKSVPAKTDVDQAKVEPTVQVPKKEQAAPTETTQKSTPLVQRTEQTPTKSAAAPAQTAPAAAAPEGSDDGFIATHLKDAFLHGNYLFIILLALLTGMALAVTPCVYPMIPVTVGFFSNQVAGNRMARVGLGLMYMLGLALTYGVVGGVSAALGGSIGALFQAPWFLFALGVLMTVLALSMFGVYEIRLPQFLGKQIHGRSGAVGALLMGLLMGFAAAPCAGPVVTAFAIKVAEFKSVPIGLLLFSSIGLGIGLPFFALGAFASGAKTLPKAGGWLQTLKALLGIVVLWIALNYFLQAFQLRSGEPKTYVVQATFLILAAVYLFLFEKSGSTQVIWGMKGLAILVCGIFAGNFIQARSTAIRDEQLSALGANTSVHWIPFTLASFEDAKKSGKPIVIDASADWCAVCHEIENAVFNKPEGIAAMQNVVALRIDQSTGVDQKYVDLTDHLFNIKGLPHVEILKPGGVSVKVVTGKDELDSPEKLKQYLAQAGS